MPPSSELLPTTSKFQCRSVVVDSLLIFVNRRQFNSLQVSQTLATVTIFIKGVKLKLAYIWFQYLFSYVTQYIDSLFFL